MLLYRLSLVLLTIYVNILQTFTHLKMYTVKVCVLIFVKVLEVASNLILLLLATLGVFSRQNGCPLVDDHIEVERTVATEAWFCRVCKLAVLHWTSCLCLNQIIAQEYNMIMNSIYERTQQERRFSGSEAVMCTQNCNSNWRYLNPRWCRQ